MGTGCLRRDERLHGSATPALGKKIIPIGSYIITTEVLPEALARELSPRNRLIYDSKNYLYYYRLTPDRRMLFGGRAAFFPESERFDPQERRDFATGMIEVYPQLREQKSNLFGAERSISRSTSCRTRDRWTGSITRSDTRDMGLRWPPSKDRRWRSRLQAGEPDNPFDGIAISGRAVGLV